jgi:hypothetical protein
VLPSKAALDHTYKQSQFGTGWLADLSWPALIRKLDREDPSYRD